MTIYRKYRAQSFNEIVGQDHVVQILKQAVLDNTFAHAYLFTGPRGTGKTSMARILAKSLNCLNPKDGQPCNKCSSCLAINSGRFMDLIEIDAASNRGIDEIRELKEGISFLPAEGKYKIYIIDEVHMLTEPAFNALLKTLEEPPKKVLFILATTEPHKIPLTIISRTQRFDFKLADSANLSIKLKRVLKGEDCKMSKDALDLVIKAGQGSYRDAETVLEKLLSALNGTKENDTKEISKEEVEKILGYVDSNTVKGFLDKLISGERVSALEIIHKVAEDGSNLSQFLKEVLEQAREQLVINVNKNYEIRQILRIIKEINQASIDIKTSMISILPIELAIINITEGFTNEVVLKEGKVVKSEYFESKKETKAKDIKLKVEKIANVEKTVTKKDINDTEKKVEKIENNSDIEGMSDEDAEIAVESINKNWDEIIKQAKKLNPFLTAIISSSKFVFKSKEGVVMKVASSFHKKQIDVLENRKNINKIIASSTGNPVHFKCIIDKTVKSNKGKDSNAKLVEELLS